MKRLLKGSRLAIIQVEEDIKRLLKCSRFAIHRQHLLVVDFALQIASYM